MMVKNNMIKLEKYTNILKGKDATNNKRLLEILGEKNESMTIADITKTMLPKNTSIYSKEFSSLNSVINRRIRALAELKYFEKLNNNKYCLSLKGLLLACILFPKISFPMIFKDLFNAEDKILSNQQYNSNQRILFESDTEKVFSSGIFTSLLKNPFEELLVSGKINLDVVSDKELRQLINEHIEKNLPSIKGEFSKSGTTKDVIVNMESKERKNYKTWLEREIPKLEEKLNNLKDFLRVLEDY